MKKKNVIILAIAMIIVIAGVIVASTIGFNKQLRYQDSQKIDIYVASEVDVDKIKSIANEVLGKQNMVQTIDSIVNKIKENYEFEQTAEKTEIKDIPATRIRDMFKKYVLPFVLSFIIILVYMVVRYRQKGILNVFAQTMAIPVLCEILLISLIAITRIPVGVYTPTLVLVVYLASITYTVIKVEKQADKN